MKSKAIFFFTILTVFLAKAQDTTITKNYKFFYGTVPNIESGAQTSIGVSSLIFDQINQAIQYKIKGKGLNFTARFINFGLVQFYWGSQLYATLPHEYFGHYSRAKEFEIEANLATNFPNLGGSTTIYVKQSTPVLQRQMIMASGPEVTANIAYKATQELYSSKYVPNYIGNYFLAGKIIDQLIYYQNNVKPFIINPNKYIIENQKELDKNPIGNDPFSYIVGLTESYGYYDSFLDKNAFWVQRFTDMSIYTQNEFIKDQSNRMEKAYLLAALDPTNFYFIYGNLLYLLNGKTQYKPFMLKIRNLKFMPSIRANLGELGVENYFDLYFKIKNFPFFSTYYRKGGNMFHEIKGIGSSVKNIKLNDNLSIDAEFDLWHNERTNKNNINLFAEFNFSNKRNLLFFITSLGYKTEGNLMGKPFSSGVYGYGGIGININQKTKLKK